MEVYVAVSGVDCEGEYILGVYNNSDNARKAILEYIKDNEYRHIEKINDDYYVINGYRYVSVKEYIVK